MKELTEKITSGMLLLNTATLLALTADEMTFVFNKTHGLLEFVVCDGKTTSLMSANTDDRQDWGRQFKGYHQNSWHVIIENVEKPFTACCVSVDIFLRLFMILKPKDALNDNTGRIFRLPIFPPWMA